MWWDGDSWLCVWKGCYKYCWILFLLTLYCNSGKVWGEFSGPRSYSVRLNRKGMGVAESRCHIRGRRWDLLPLQDLPYQDILQAWRLSQPLTSIPALPHVSAIHIVIFFFFFLQSPAAAGVYSGEWTLSTIFTDRGDAQEITNKVRYYCGVPF